MKKNTLILFALAVSLLVIFIHSFKSNIYNQNCTDYILSSTAAPSYIFILSNDLPNILTYKQKEKHNLKKKIRCLNWEKHFSTINNFGKEFKGVFLTGSQYSYVLEAGSLVSDLDIEQVKSRNAYYDKYLPHKTFYMNYGIYPLTDDNKIKAGVDIDNEITCRDFASIISVWSNVKIFEMDGLENELIDNLIHDFVGLCQGNLKITMKSQSKSLQHKKEISRMFSNAYVQYYRNPYDESLSQKLGLEVYNDILSNIADDCPKKFEVISEAGFCLEYR